MTITLVAAGVCIATGAGLIIAALWRRNGRNGH
jgi:hypothetical protein